MLCLYSHAVAAPAATADSLKKSLAGYTKEDTTRISILLALSRVYFNQQSDSMLVYSRKALALSEKLRLPAAQASSLGQIGLALYTSGHYDSSLSYLRQSLALARQNKFTAQYAPRYTSIGNVYLRQNKYTQALIYYDSAGKAALTYNDTGELARINNNIAVVHFGQGNYAKSLRYYLEGLELNEKLGNKGDVETGLLNISNVFFRLQQYGKAKEYAARSLAMAKQSGSKWSEISVQTTYAMIYNEEKKYDSSLRCLQQAMDTARAMNNDYLVNLLKGNMAECYLNKGDVAKALPLYTESLTMSRQLDDALGVALAKGGIGQIWVRQGNTAQGMAYIEEAFGILQANGMKEQAMTLADTLANVYARTGNYKEALTYHHIKDAYADSLTKDKARGETQAMEYAYQLQKKEAQIALLEKDNAIEEARIKQDRIFLAAALAGMLLAIVIAYQFFRNLRNAKNTNKLILAQKREIELQAEKLTKLNNFKDTTFSVLSHDLRSPINALTGTMAMLDAGIITPAEFAEHKDELNNKLQSVTLMLDNLLQWAKSQMLGQQTLEIEKINVRRKALKSIAMLKDAATQKNISITTDAPEDLYVQADRNQLQMVMRNLLSNAVKFTPDNGLINISAGRQDKYIAISVKDSGVGMTQQQADSLFDGSANASTSGTGGEKGTGIGLHLSYSFISGHGGDIKVQSRPGSGTTFTILLPAERV